MFIGRAINLRGPKLYDVGLIRETIFDHLHEIFADALVFDAVMFDESFLEGIESDSSYSTVEMCSADDFNEARNGLWY